jgi:hypothetical protein
MALPRALAGNLYLAGKGRRRHRRNRGRLSRLGVRNAGRRGNSWVVRRLGAQSCRHDDGLLPHPAIAGCVANVTTAILPTANTRASPRASKTFRMYASTSLAAYPCTIRHCRRPRGREHDRGPGCQNSGEKSKGNELFHGHISRVETISGVCFVMISWGGGSVSRTLTPTCQGAPKRPFHQQPGLVQAIAG